MGNGWNQSADAWIAAVGERGDWGREHVLDPVMLERISSRPFENALDVGCGEGRFCRTLKERRIAAIGIDPTEALLAEARRRDPTGDYRAATAEQLPFPDASFDLVVSYLTLIDITDYRVALREMVRVLRPKGVLLIANLNGFVTSRPFGWITDSDGNDLYYPVDHYLDEFAEWVEFSGLRIQNWHRPLSAYMKVLLSQGLTLTFFDEPSPRSGDTERQRKHRRAPWFHVMEWLRPG
jgi:SAM-dependent methyltransferase